eukprot:6208204-Pleurochrysis_carterae.AAC.3
MHMGAGCPKDVGEGKGQGKLPGEKSKEVSQVAQTGSGGELVLKGHGTGKPSPRRGLRTAEQQVLRDRTATYVKSALLPLSYIYCLEGLSIYIVVMANRNKDLNEVYRHMGTIN